MKKSGAITVHEPILVAEIVEHLVDAATRLADEPGWIVDVTAGGGGHTEKLLQALESRGLSTINVLSSDQDEAALARVRLRCADWIDRGRLKLVHARMSELGPELSKLRVVGLLADLGFSSDQLEDGARGLSFNREGPLDMRLDPSRGEPVVSLLTRVRESELADLIFEFGEDRHSRRIARMVVEARARGQLPQTTTEFAELVSRAYPVWDRKGRIHPATRTFQALRVWVNSELDELDSLLSSVILNVVPGGRVAVLSFHSLEDRKVKLTFREEDKELGRWKVLTKKPIEPSDDEVQSNPRARSAKLRVAERL